MIKGVLQRQMKNSKQQHSTQESIKFIGKGEYIGKYRVLYYANGN